MTKKDYILIAKAFDETIYKIKNHLEYRKTKRKDLNDSIQVLFNELSYLLKQENSNFDKNKFMTACKIHTLNQ